MRGWIRAVGTMVLVAGTMTSATVVDAGDVPPPPLGQLSIDLRVIGPAATEIDDWDPEVFVEGSNEFLVLCNQAGDFDQPLSAGRLYSCPVDTVTTMTLGFPTPPEPYQLEWSCNTEQFPNEAFDDPAATFTIDGDAVSSVSCEITMSTGMVFVDKEFPADALAEGTPGPDPDGGAEHGDFTFEVYDITEGGVSGAGDLVGTGTDDDPDQCASFADADAGTCLVLLVPPGDYVLGEQPLPGYLPAPTARTSEHPAPSGTASR